MVERNFRQKAIESKRFTTIGRWWDRKGENEKAEHMLTSTHLFDGYTSEIKGFDLSDM